MNILINVVRKESAGILAFDPNRSINDIRISALALSHIVQRAPENYIPRIMTYLTQTLRTRDNDDAREVIAEALGEIDILPSIQLSEIMSALISALKDPVSRIKITAARSLYEIGKRMIPEHIPALIVLLTQIIEDQDKEIREIGINIFKLLIEFVYNNEKKFSQKYIAELIAFLALALKNQNDDLRLTAAIVFSKNVEVLPKEHLSSCAAIINQATSDNNINVRKVVSRVLNEINRKKPRRYIPVKVSTLSREDMMRCILIPLVVPFAFILYFSIEFAKFKRRISNYYTNFLLAYIIIHSKVGCQRFTGYIPGIVAALSQALRNGENGVRSFAVNALEKIGKNASKEHIPNIVLALTLALEGGDYAGHEAVEALGRIGSKAAVEHIPNILLALTRALELGHYTSEVTLALVYQIRQAANEHIPLEFIKAVSNLQNIVNHDKNRDKEALLKFIPLSKYIEILSGPDWISYAPYLIEQAIQRNSPIYIESHQHGIHLCLIENNRVIRQPITVEQANYFRRSSTAIENPISSYVSKYN